MGRRGSGGKNGMALMFFMPRPTETTARHAKASRNSIDSKWQRTTQNNACTAELEARLWPSRLVVRSLCQQAHHLPRTKADREGGGTDATE